LKKIFISLFVIAIFAGGAFYYYQNYHEKQVDPWLLVPSSAVLAYENQSLIENWNKTINTSIWKTLKKIPYFHAWEKGLAIADSLSGRNGSIDKLFRDKSLIISAHIISSQEFDFLFNLNVGEGGKGALNKILASIQKESGIISESRNYQGFEIRELIHKKTQSTFTYFIYKNVVVGSFTAFLVEDVVRNVTNDFKDTFKEQIPSLSSISKLENDDGNLYIDFAKLPGFIASFLDSERATEVQGLRRFSGDTFLDIKITDHEILLNGISNINLNRNNSFIGTFRNQNPIRLSITELIPNNAAILYHFGFSDFKEWQSQVTKYWSADSPEQFQSYLDFEDKYDLDLDWIGGEAANAILETPNREKPDQLILMTIKDQTSAREALSAFAEQVSLEQQDSVYQEMYNDVQIIQLSYEEFPRMILGNYFSGFENSFIAFYDRYLVIGNSMKSVKDLLDAVENENIWGKSVRQNLFMENTLSESNYSMMINTSLCWPWLIESLGDRWAKLFEQYERQLKSFGLIAVQVSNLDHTFYTSLALGHQALAAATPKVGRLKKLQSIYSISPIVTKPFIVRNHNNNNFEVLFQDSLDILYQVSNEGEVLWGDSIQERIVSDIHQIDFYKNGKLQYLFATKNKVHLLDRNGDYVEGFPVIFKEGVELDHLSVVDYDNSKRYRLMAVDKKGNIFLLSKEGKQLEGWNPRPMNGPLALPGFHVRVKGGDCMVALQRDGILNVMNRRGNMYPGFPIDLKVDQASGIFLDIGNDFSATRLITISNEGEIIEVNLKGKILRREQLYKPSRESRFWLVPDALKKTFVIFRQEYNKVSVLDLKGEVMFEYNISSSSDLTAQYYNFSVDNQFYIVLDPQQEFAYIFDQDGQAVSFEPIESGFPVGLLYLSRYKEYHLYKNYNKNFSVESFK
jgi:hypothetical protein